MVLEIKIPVESKFQVSEKFQMLYLDVCYYKMQEHYN